MLILKLYCDRSVRIGPDITVTVVRTLAGALVLAISAPPSLKIKRAVSSAQQPRNGFGGQKESPRPCS